MLFVASFILYSQTDKHKVVFNIVAKGVNEKENIYICGNQDSLGFWNPGLLPFTKVNDSTWTREFIFVKGTNLEFKFTKGSWEQEALNDDGTVPGNSMFLIVKDTTLKITIKKWGRQKSQINHGQITGSVKYHRNFEGDGIKPRDIIVWLPPSYEDNPNKRYPVLYMHDGQNIIDPVTSSFGYDWRIDEVADSLIKAGKIKEIIIVGIYNTADRGLEYVYSPLGYTYMDFLVNKLKPYIDNEYRTLPEKENTATCGASLGGLISLMIAWNHPAVFSKAACLSSAFKIGLINYVDTILSYTGTKKDIKLYIDIGEIGLEADLKHGNDEMIAALLSKGYDIEKDLIYFVDNNAVHSESAWASRIWRPLLFFFGK